MRLNEAKAELKKLNQQLPLTKELKKQREKLEKQIKHYKSKVDFTGENHSQKPKR
jgi:hypothetical protein